MANDSTDFGMTETRERAISANAAKVLETTRRAWQGGVAERPAEDETRRAPSGSPKRRVKPRRSQWGNLVAAMNYWSPRPL
jgi:hypothetical protein